MRSKQARDILLTVYFWNLFNCLPINDGKLSASVPSSAPVVAFWCLRITEGHGSSASVRVQLMMISREENAIATGKCIRKLDLWRDHEEGKIMS